VSTILSTSEKTSKKTIDKNIIWSIFIINGENESIKKDFKPKQKNRQCRFFCKKDNY